MSGTRMAEKSAPVAPEVIDTANVVSELLERPLPTYEYDSDHENPSDVKRLFIAETWGIEEREVAGFGELRRDPGARAAFIAEWDDEPALEYFEDFVHQLSYNRGRLSNSELAADAAQELLDALDVEEDIEPSAAEVRALFARLRTRYGAQMLAEAFPELSLEPPTPFPSHHQDTTGRPVTETEQES